MISSIILTWNSSRYIERNLFSLIEDLNSLKEQEWEIIVVDGGSTDDTLAKVKIFQYRYTNIKTIELGKNLGTTKSRNIGIRNSKGEYLLVLDSDTEIIPGAIEELLNTISKDKSIGIIAPRLLYPDKKVQPSCKKFPTAKSVIFKNLPLRIFYENGVKDELYCLDIYTNKDSVDVDYCISAAWLLRRKAIEDIGFLDEKIFYSPEDVDYCLRMHLRRWKVIYNPKAEIIHHTQRLSHKNLYFTFSHLNGFVYFFRKHKYIINRYTLYKRM